MTELEQRTMERVGKARARLILERRFYCVLVSNVDPQVSRRLPTAATNGKTHLWNPEYVAGCRTSWPGHSRRTRASTTRATTAHGVAHVIPIAGTSLAITRSTAT